MQVAVQNRDKTFVGSPQDGIDSTLTYTYQGDKVLTQTAKTLFLMTNWGLQRRGKTALEPVSKQYEDIKGLDYKLTYEDKQAIEKLTINYEKLDYDKAKKWMVSRLMEILLRESA